MRQVIRSDLICERCNQQIVLLTEDELGEPIDWSIKYEQYLCDECYEKIWDELMEDCCPRCNTHPCEKGRDCWINPFPHIMYLCYIAPRVHPSPPKVPLTIKNMPLHHNQETLDIFFHSLEG